MKAKLEQILADVVGAPVSVTRPEPQFGDFATNVAMQLAGQQGRSPREIAEDIANKLRQQPEITEVTVAGPGFINIHLSDTALLQALQAQPAQTLAGQTVLAEYSDPNPFKPLHAGHLYTTLVGDVLSRILEAAGAQVIRLNFGGDVGPHVAKSMWAIVQELGGEDPSKLTEVEDRPRWLGERYVEGNNAYEDNPEAQAEIKEYNRRIYEIQATGDHESPLAQMYWTCRQWSYDYFAELYRQLQVKPFDRFIPESEVTPLGLATVQKELQNGVFTESDGAVVFPGEKYGLHTRVFINQQGLPTYEAKDVGLSLTKWQDYPDFTESIIITANEQAEYMRVVLAAIKQFAPEPAERTKHLTHGMVKLAGGVKMSSRKGNVVTALELLEAARQAAPEASEETILAAVKYALTKNRMGGDIAYDPRESIALEGNSGPYLQYAHARARSILIDHSLFMGHNGAEIQRGRDGAVRIRSPYDQIAKTGRSGSANVATIVAPNRGGMLRARIYDLASKNQPEPAEIRITPHKDGNRVEVFLDNKHFVRPTGEDDFAVSGHIRQATPDEPVRINACADALMALTDPEAHRAEVAPIDPSMAANFGRIALQ